eukprot:COSAG01_NODE_6972_length_3410_cov_3.379644_2_plen_232_part_00
MENAHTGRVNIGLAVVAAYSQQRRRRRCAYISTFPSVLMRSALLCTHRHSTARNGSTGTALFTHQRLFVRQEDLHGRPFAVIGCLFGTQQKLAHLLRSVESMENTAAGGDNWRRQNGKRGISVESFSGNVWSSSPTPAATQPCDTGSNPDPTINTHSHTKAYPVVPVDDVGAVAAHAALRPRTSLYDRCRVQVAIAGIDYVSLCRSMRLLFRQCAQSRCSQPGSHVRGGYK